jgi:hypothetical protein
MMEYADPQQMSIFSAILITVIHLSSWTRALTRWTLSAVREVVRRPELSPLMTLVLPLRKLCSHWYTFLCLKQFFFSRSVLTFFCHSLRFLPSSDHKFESQNVAQQWSNPKAEPTFLHYDCMSFTGRNGYSTTCLDLAQYVASLMSARAQSNKLPEFYMQIVLTFFKFHL